ncbi:MAG: ATP-binding protein, partial [Planctomycetota bacterium]
SESDLQALVSDKRPTNLPELSRGAITQLAGPARDVRMHQMQLKQSRQQIESDRKEAERLHAERGEFLAVRNADDLQGAIRNASEHIQAIRKYQQVEERLEKLIKHREELEGESVDLESDDGFSWERVLMLSIPFFIGAFLFLSGLNNFFGWYNSNSMPNASRLVQAPNNDPQNTGVLMTVLGLLVLVATYVWWKSMERGMAGDITECESQLDALMSQVRKTEQEKKDLSLALPEHGGSMEQLLREAEHELANCEALLPVYHNEQAARQRMQSAKRQGAQALAGLKASRSQWQKTLQQIGLADSLSPKSIRILAEGYESLSQTRKRYKAQNDELSQRKIELNSAIQKLDAISTQLHVALTESANGKDATPNMKIAALSSPVSTQTIEAPQQRLQELVNTLAQHQQFLAQRRELKNEDEELGKKQKHLRRLMERTIRARQAMLADLAVETPQQLEEHLARKKEHLRLESEIRNLDERIKGLISVHVTYDAVSRMLESSSASDLEKRWETLGSRISGAEERIGQLLQRQGEISQEMKTLAADRRLAEAKLELSCLDRQIELCAAHWRTLGVTTCMLEKVCEVYETERQPETLREASTFLKQLTDGKYIRVWTPLGKNALRIDNERGQSLPLEVLSRGTREAVFIALRLSLAAAYSRRGVTLPLVLDDVLVNFDSTRATHAAKVLRDFAALGHQVVMFTCHEHIMKMFHAIDVQVRVLPEQGVPGEARVYDPGLAPSVPAPKPVVVATIVEAPEVEPVPQVVSVNPVVL